MSGGRKWKKSLRLDFRYESYNIELVSQTHVDILSQLSDPIEDADNNNGCYLKLTGPEKDVFYVQRLQNPFRTDAEAYGSEAEHPITYERLKEPDLTFSVLIPDPGFIFTLEIINYPLQPGLFVKLARQSFTFTIDPAEEILPPVAIARVIENGVVLGKKKIVDHGSNNE